MNYETMKNQQQHRRPDYGRRRGSSCHHKSLFLDVAWIISMVVVLVISCRTVEAFHMKNTRNQHHHPLLSPSATTTSIGSISRCISSSSSSSRAIVILSATNKQSRYSKIIRDKNPKKVSSSSDALLVDEEKPAGITGAQFFGGNKQKEELFDPAAEERAEQEQDISTDDVYFKFHDEQAFPGDKRIQSIAKGIQTKINNILYYDEEEWAAKAGDNPIAVVEYSNNLDWQGCFPSSAKSPLKELETALEFYRRLDVAITSGKVLDSSSSSSEVFQVQLEWQISLLWPIYWEPRVLLTGNTILTIMQTEEAEEENGGGGKFTITKQIDQLDGKDMLNVVGSQVQPRFWDTYHIGMTPYAETMTRTASASGGGSPLKKYDLYEIPSRLVFTPTQLDSLADRGDRNAQTIPNHAFSGVIKTVGPQKQRFVPTSPTQVQIRPLPEGKSTVQLKWCIPLSVEFQTKLRLPLPGEDPEARINTEPKSSYEFQQRRKVATLRYGGDPQDDEIADIRKQLYEQVVKDGFQPKLDESGRPQFFFFQNGLKSCFTEDGLGMCVYEWRPEFVKPNEVGLELEL